MTIRGVSVKLKGCFRDFAFSLPTSNLDSPSKIIYDFYHGGVLEILPLVLQTTNNYQQTTEIIS